jgi:hypothetical protein
MATEQAVPPVLEPAPEPVVAEAADEATNEQAIPTPVILTPVIGGGPPGDPPDHVIYREAIHLGEDRWYCVTWCKQRPELEGIWFCPWTHLEERLPGRNLKRSGARLQRFDTLEDCRELWRLKRGNVPPPRHNPW